MGTTSLPTSLQQFLQDFIARRRRLAVVKAAAVAVAAALAIALGACLVDRLVQLPGAVRAALLLIDLAAIVAVLRRPMAEALAGQARWVEAARQIESLEPAFAQRLITVTSQLQSPETYRGSPGMLAALVDDLQRFTAGRRATDLLGWRRITRALVIAACFVTVTAGAMAVPWLDLPRLMARFTRPWADIAAVTTTRLAVDPGHIRLPQGRPLIVTVQPQRLGDSPLRLYLKEPDGWTPHDLTPGLDGRYVVELPPPPKSTQYFVTGGDARSETFDVELITVPTLTEVRARVKFPAYLHWPEKSFAPADKLDLPAGSEVSLSLVGSEPLADATLAPQGGKRIATTASVDPLLRVARMTVSKDLSLTATLTSRQGVVQPAATPVVIKSIPDRPPLVRLLVPSDELRLYPTDVLSTACQAMDDYGIQTLALAIKINDRAPVYQPVTIAGDRRRIEQAIDCDLAALGVVVGDVLQVSLLAKDGAGQQRSSEALRAIISPRAFDLNAYLRQGDLKAARAALVEAHKQLSAARDQLHQSADAIKREGDRTLQALASAGQFAERAETPLLRAATRTDRRELGDSLAAWFDVAEHARAVCETMAEQRARAMDPGSLRGPIDQAIERLRRANEQLEVITRGYTAAVLRDDQATAASVRARADRAQGTERDQLQAAAKRLLTAANAAAREANLDGSFDGLVNRAEQHLKQNPPIDFEPTAREFSAILQRVAAGNVLAERASYGVNALSPRLAAAGMIEMVRPDADFVRARDLALASRAARAIATPVLAVSAQAKAMKQAAKEFPGALHDLQAAHRLVRQPRGDAEGIESAAALAREKMRRWAGEADAKLAMAAEPLALEQAAALQQRQFEKLKQLEQAQARSAKLSRQQQQQLRELAQQAAAVKRLDELRERQEKLAKQSAQAKNQQAVQQTAQAQQKLAEDVAKAADQLAEDAKKTNSAADAIAGARRALSELKAENDEVRQARNDEQPKAAAAKMDPSATEASAEKLAAAGSATEASRQHIEEEILPEARAMRQDAANAAAANGHAAKLDKEIAQGQKKLDEAEEQLAERDALAAAQAAARESAQQMQRAAADGKKSADTRSAEAAQKRAAAALDKASARAVMTGGRARIAELPVIADLFSLLPLLEAPGVAAAGPGVTKLDLPAVREWGRLRQRQDPNQTAVAPQADPPGYESALRAYFDALGKEK